VKLPEKKEPLQLLKIKKKLLSNK